MKLKELIVILSACTAVAATAQDSSDAWSLQQCIEYAYAHNISIGQSRLSIESSAVDLREAKEQLFPSLSFSTAHDYSQSPYNRRPFTKSCHIQWLIPHRCFLDTFRRRATLLRHQEFATVSRRKRACSTRDRI